MTMQGRLSPAAFRSFQDGRSDEEPWELIDGMPVMTPPPIDHNRIASTLERLLNDTLERHDPNREAVQRRIELTVWQRGPDGWDQRRLTDPGTTLDLPDFGLLCPVGSLYPGTHLRPRGRS